MLKGLRNKNDLTRGVFNDQFETEMLSGKEQYLKTEIHTLSLEFHLAKYEFSLNQLNYF